MDKLRPSAAGSGSRAAMDGVFASLNLSTAIAKPDDLGESYLNGIVFMCTVSNNTRQVFAEGINI